MRFLAIIAAGAIVVGAGTLSHAAPIAPAKTDTGIVLVQEKKKETVTEKVKKTTENVKQKVKRTWKNMTGYKFAVACPAFPPITTKTCTETGKDREEARAKCASQNPLCSVRDAK